MPSTTVRGQFVWHDLITPNSAGAHEFYRKTVGWKQQAWDSDSSYLMFVAPNGPIGGAVEGREDTPHWLPYIGTDDVDSAVEAATRLGARVLTPAATLPSGGRYAVLADPQGAEFAMYSSNDSASDDAGSQPGQFSWHELATSVAPNIAFGFYAALFDWDEVSQTDMGPMGMYLIFGRNGRQLGGMYDKTSGGRPGNPYWLGYVSVTDLEGTIERATSARGSVLVGPMDVPGGDRIAQLMDPYGAFFALHKAAGETVETAAVAARKLSRKAASKKRAATKPAKKRARKKTPAKRAKPVGRKKAKKTRAAKKKTARKAAKGKPRKAAARKAKKRR